METPVGSLVRRLFLALGFAGTLFISACAGHRVYSLPALPFEVTFPLDYGYTESETAYFFSSDGSGAVFYFEKEPEPRPFFELFEGGYEEWTEKSTGVWVICEREMWENCYVQNLASAELYPLHVRSEERSLLSEVVLEEIQFVLTHIRAD